MGFDAILGNGRLKENLQSALQKGRTSHFYLLSGPEGAGKHTLARHLAAALLCGSGEKPCLRCNTCRKVLSGLHPDVITVDDPEKKTVPVDLIRRIREDLFVRPNEGEKKIYLFPRAQDLGLPGQNALLKVLEEPPKYGIFLLLTDNPEKLLPTVRSRCVELRLLPLEENLLRKALQAEFPQAQPDAIDGAIARSGGYLGQAKALLSDEAQVSPQLQGFADALAKRDALLLTQVLVPLEKWKRDAFVELVEAWIQCVQGALSCRAGMPSISPLSTQLAATRSGTELNAIIGQLKKAAEYAQGNVSVAAICGWLARVL